jgi:hypothetical protein
LTDDELDEKFRRLVEPVCGVERTGALLQEWRGIATVADVSTVLSMFDGLIDDARRAS